MTDIALKQFNDGGFDVDIEGGDLLADDGLRTAVLISLFTDRITENDDIIPDGSDNRRGYWADAYSPGDRVGSLLWILSCEMQTVETLSRAEEYASEALQWLIDDGIASSVTNVASWLDDGMLCLQTTITRSNNTLFQDVFNFSLEAL